MAIFAYLM